MLEWVGRQFQEMPRKFGEVKVDAVMERSDGAVQKDQALRPLFRWGSGMTLKRTEVQYLLQKAATAEGLPADRFLSHSLRIGGASALYQVTADVELVKRMGRWSSSAVQRYLHDGGRVLKELSGRMARVDQRVHYT
ncbi:unnamed protein product [Cladocopium goreaui]|uniref:Tyr recombinase domain-containing protein n=1 Tax=Cladocopium goreaui TaxID=2562237 RepID=A0A9P1M0V6_9DINO|nr:unnamed protein product [Cladocopium goreaui]